jgi:phosphoglycolate phosphatase-like HAD superfamily hydrolase
LAAAANAAPTRFGPIKGAGDALDFVRSAGWAIALATGGWGASARLKLSVAGLDIEGAAFASSDDGSTREEILRIAVRRAQSSTSEPFQRVVSVGDAAWDVRCASSVGVAFVGIGAGERAARMRSAGAACVLPDLEEPARVLVALNAAVIPAVGVRSV